MAHYRGIPKASTKEALTATRCMGLVGYEGGKEVRCRRELTKEDLARHAWLCTACLGMEEAQVKLKAAQEEARQRWAAAHPAMKWEQRYLGDDLDD